MRHGWKLLPILFLLAMPLLVASCGDDDDDGPTGPTGQQADIPEVPQAEFESDAEFNSSDQNATTAEQMVDGMLLSASALSGLGQAFMAPLAGADWDDAGDNSWEWTYTEGGCSWSYAASETASGYEWSLTINGNCSGTVYVNWVAM